MLSRFNKIFGIQEPEGDEKRRFVQRINQTIFDMVEDLSCEKVFRTLCYRLGINADDRISKVNQFNYGVEINIPSLRSLTNDEFLPTLKVLILLYGFFDSDKTQQEKISSWVETALSNATIDLGIRWENGTFYTSGSKFLDEKLIDDVLGVLNDEDKKGIRISFEKGLREFIESIKDEAKFKNVIRDMQVSLDETSKVLLNDKNVGFKQLLKDKNWDKIIKNKYYQKIFVELNEFADKLAKHKSDTEFDKYEVETFIYLTGIFIRLVFVNK